MIDIGQFRSLVVRPTLERLDAHSAAAENLVLGTALQESALRYLHQLGSGPALGLFQMEPATHDDLWDSYLAHRADLRERVAALLAPGAARLDQLVWNLGYATAMCRVHYRRVPAALPDAGDVAGLAAYWKQYYNTPAGRGRPEEFIDKYERLVLGAGVT